MGSLEQGATRSARTAYLFGPRKPPRAPAGVAWTARSPSCPVVERGAVVVITGLHQPELFATRWPAAVLRER